MVSHEPKPGRLAEHPGRLDRIRPGVIAIRGAREHNLRDLSVDIPQGKLVVVTGVSGSGKSTLAFDLLFAEGQRRFLDSMNAYARQFVDQLPRPDVDLIAGLPPTVSIEQRNSRGGGKSTVATVTEVYHFLRLLFARLGIQHCPNCKEPVIPQTRDQVTERLRAETRRRGPLTLLAPVIRGRKGFHTEVAQWALNHGYAQIRADGQLLSSDKPLRLERFREHNVEIVIGTFSGDGTGRARQPPCHQLVDQTLEVGHGVLCALDGSGHLTVHSTERTCPGCGQSFQPLDPKLFSYNSPQGWCPRCRGFGELFYLPDVERGARADAIEESWFGWMEGQREVCPECQGGRLQPLARMVRLPFMAPRAQAEALRRMPAIGDFNAASVEAARDYFATLRVRGREAEIARDIFPEIRERLKFLDQVGLGYLDLGRAIPTLSGGEGQRIRLAAQMGSNLSGVLYILDEPTIGLHPRDNARLLSILARLRARGNSLVVVEHDEATMRQADHIIDLGPGAGVHGGQVVATGTLAQLQRHRESITGRCLRERRTFPSRGARRPVRMGPRRVRTGPNTPKAQEGAVPPDITPCLVLTGASVHNLKNLTVRFPLGRLVVVAGVSGSGKSTLIRECLLPALRSQLERSDGKELRVPLAAGKGARIAAGREGIRAVYDVDQTPIGRTPRSTPATYVGFFDEIRQLFAQLPEARLRGYGPGRFSFNSPKGRCPTCEGAGAVKLEMSFLPPALARCDACQGLRFNPETLDILFQGRTVAQVLDLSVAEAIEAFGAFPRIRRCLDALQDTGLGYLRLGQTSPTLSGGEAQRVKLVTHLLSGLSDRPHEMGRNLKRNLFVLEEPTIGLHAADVKRLVDVIQRLVDAGHSVVVIEHNLDLIAEADWVIELGPEGGEAGGRIIAEGTPEAVASSPDSPTGAYLKPLVEPRAGGKPDP